jgi:hypothetical protein
MANEQGDSPQYVSHKSEEYSGFLRSVREGEKEVDDQGSDSFRIFGARTSERIKSIRDNPSSVPPDGLSADEQISAILQGSREDLQRIIELSTARNKFSSESFPTNTGAYFFSEALKDPKVALKTVAAFPPKSRIDIVYPSYLVKRFADIPDDLYETMLHSYVDRLAKKEHEFREQVPERKKRFLERLQNFVNHHGISIDMQEVQEKVDQTPVYLEDMLFKHRPGPDGRLLRGQLEPSYGRVIIKSNTPKGEMDEVFNHEMLHGCAGKTIERLFGGGELIQPRTGLGMSGQYKWLDEATTETVAQAISLDKKDRNYRRFKKKGYGRYKDEIGLIAGLLTKGRTIIDKELLFKAYFEDFNTEAEQGQERPAWNTFVSAVDGAFGDGFLKKLDDYVDTFGVQKATVDLFSDPELIQAA